MVTLEKILIVNSFISLGAHAVIGWRWVKKNALTTERKLEITLHAREHGGPLKDCAECASLGFSPENLQVGQA